MNYLVMIEDMEYSGIITQMEVTKPNLQETVDIISRVLSNEIVDLSPKMFERYHPNSDLEENQLQIKELFHQIKLKTQLSQIPDRFVEDLCKLLDRMILLIPIQHLEPLKEIIRLRLSWSPESPKIWYEFGKVQYQRFVKRDTNNQDEIIKIFEQVIHQVEQVQEDYELGFWAYAYMANLHLYRILSGEEALIQAMKNYNYAYRYSQVHDIGVEKDFIFDDIKILQNILMYDHPLLVLIYNQSGVSLFEYLFQFVEVVTQQRFISNFTALLSVVDERINELFNSPISNAYIVIENRLFMIVSLYDKHRKESVKIAFIFSYLQKNEDDIEINRNLLVKVKNFKAKLAGTEYIRDYLMNFDGKHDHAIMNKIEQILHASFDTAENT